MRGHIYTLTMKIVCKHVAKHVAKQAASCMHQAANSNACNLREAMMRTHIKNTKNIKKYNDSYQN